MLPVAHPEAAEALRGHAGLGLNPAAAAVLRVLPAVLLHAPAGAGKHALAARVSDELGAHLMDRCALSLLRGGVEPAQVAHALGMLLAEARRAAPCVLVLRRLELLGDALRAEAAAAGEQPAAAADDAAEAWADVFAAAAVARHDAAVADADTGAAAPPAAVVLIGTARALEGVPAPLRRAFQVVLKLGAPPAAARLAALHLSAADFGGDARVRERAARLAAEQPRLGARGWQLACSRAQRLAARQQHAQRGSAWRCDASAESPEGAAGSAGTAGPEGPERPEDSASSGAAGDRGGAARCFGVPELREAVAQMEKRAVAAAGSATVPDVRWSDVGGQHEAKASCLPPTFPSPATFLVSGVFAPPTPPPRSHSAPSPLFPRQGGHPRDSVEAVTVCHRGCNPMHPGGHPRDGPATAAAAASLQRGAAAALWSAALRPTGHGQDAARQGGGHGVPAGVPVRQGTRARLELCGRAG